mmetsp:Transcript_9311/g.28189  ORF Transcript_9311/g.28189 Transcript_9311/m.28189 type:complete len:359 (+) Transcript_9311:529-1605(+)
MVSCYDPVALGDPSLQAQKKELTRSIFCARARCSALCSSGERPSNAAITWKAPSAFSSSSSMYLHTTCLRCSKPSPSRHWRSASRASRAEARASRSCCLSRATSFEVDAPAPSGLARPPPSTGVPTTGVPSANPPSERRSSASCASLAAMSSAERSLSCNSLARMGATAPCEAARRSSSFSIRASYARRAAACAASRSASAARVACAASASAVARRSTVAASSPRHSLRAASASARSRAPRRRSFSTVSLSPLACCSTTERTAASSARSASTSRSRSSNACDWRPFSVAASRSRAPSRSTSDRVSCSACSAAARAAATACTSDSALASWRDRSACWPPRRSSASASSISSRATRSRAS